MNGLWISVAVLGGLFVIWGLAKFVQTLRSDPELTGIPASPMEKLARLGAVISGLLGVGMIGLVALKGVTAFDRAPEVRAVFAVLILVGVGLWLAAWVYTNRKNGGVALDERDRSVLTSSLAAESVLVLLSVLVWTAALTEAFWNEKAVPLEYLQLLFWSTFLLSVFGRSIGIILGYRRSGLDA